MEREWPTVDGQDRTRANGGDRAEGSRVGWVVSRGIPRRVPPGAAPLRGALRGAGQGAPHGQ
eukprot:3242486-Pleurochrysis_carterae.AAC.2